MLNPRQVCDFAKALGRLAKNRLSMRPPGRVRRDLEGHVKWLKEALRRVGDALRFAHGILSNLGPHRRSSQAWTRSTTSGFVLRSAWLSQ